MTNVATVDFQEEAFALFCEGEQLIAVLCTPAVQVPRSGLVVVNGGPQYRAGAHRHFVQFSRALAAMGHLVLRFDPRGTGDSTGEPAGFERVGPDMDAAVQAVRQRLPTGTPLALWGLCDGASAAALYLGRSRSHPIDGLAMLNPWVRSEATLAQARVRFWYLQRLRQKEFWRKFLRGGVGTEALRGLLKNLQAASSTGQQNLDYRVAMLQGLEQSSVPAIVHIADQDMTGREFLTYAKQEVGWRRLAESSRLQVIALPHADHTLTSPAAQVQLAKNMHSFLCGLRTRSSSS